MNVNTVLASALEIITQLQVCGEPGGGAEAGVFNPRNV